MKKYIFNFSWFVFLHVYVFLYFLFLSCVAHVSDEYEGGNKLAEFGSDVFVYIFAFPLNIVAYLLEPLLDMNSKNALPLFISNFLINGFICTTLFNFIYMKGKTLFRKPGPMPRTSD